VKRKSILVAVISVALVAGGALASLYALLGHEPEFYRRAAVDAGLDRRAEAGTFQSDAFDLVQNRIPHDPEWQARFTDRQINSWLAEGLANIADLPPEISEPRVTFEEGKILIAFRYGRAGWESVVSVEARAWVSPREPNVVCLEIERLRAGALPMGSKVLEDALTEHARSQNIDVQWYRRDTHPVALLRFQADRRDPTFQLQRLDIQIGAIHLKGRSLDPDLLPPSLPSGT
jgi:hypothetical protein